MSLDMNIDKFKFQSPTNILVAGSTQSGKTVFVIKLINHCKNLFSEPPVKVIYCYSIFQKKFNEITNSVQFHQGLPNIDEIADTQNRHVLIVIDDLMQSINSQIVDLFTVKTHHQNISCVFILQNMFFQNKHLRTMSLNSHYLCLFRASRDNNQVNVLARQIFGTRAKNFLKIYDEVMREPYTYLLINMHPSNKYRVSVHKDIFPDEYEIIFLE